MRREYTEQKHAAVTLITAKAERFAALYGFAYGRISVKDQRTVWGSCSRKGNLNFNYKIVALPERLQDYIILHEICHLGELNHSRRFWELVARTMPDHAALRQELRLASLRLRVVRKVRVRRRRLRRRFARFFR